MACCCAPALQVCGSLMAGGASLVDGGASLMAGGASLVAGGAPCWLVVHPVGWWCILVSSGRILQPGTQAGARTHPSVRRRSRLDGSLSGFFFIGYSSICQLFKFSYRMPYAKVFTDENLIKSLFSANYRGFFIIQAAHLTVYCSHFLHKTDTKHVENQ